MSLSLSKISIPVFVRTLQALGTILDKAAAHCAAKKIDETVMTATRLTPDMYALARQVQVTCFFAHGATARLAGAEPPTFEDTDKTFAELKARIAKTIDYVKSADTAAIDAAGDKEIVFPIGPNRMKMPGADYLIHFALPNFHFHMMAAYAILRQAGVEIGKRDYMGPVPNIGPA